MLTKLLTSWSRFKNCQFRSLWVKPVNMGDVQFLVAQPVPSSWTLPLWLEFNLEWLVFAWWKARTTPLSSFTPATNLYFVRGTNFEALEQSLWSYYMVRCLIEPLKSLWDSCCFIYFLIRDNPFSVAASLLFVQLFDIFTPLSLHTWSDSS